MANVFNPSTPEAERQEDLYELNNQSTLVPGQTGLCTETKKKETKPQSLNRKKKIKTTICLLCFVPITVCMQRKCVNYILDKGGTEGKVTTQYFI